ncbi:methyltransferase domain-containing protein [Cyanobium sp. ATX 6F1]|uniref:methyltransferase domain-containing protein n=1 Tax=Cyanobium sp. ATX 6F1 TaxID=2823702 RepID=UPI0020CCFE48|nr:methyltransferase domain-containing protein [Cyanobium sp. ATX 6F1]MCP9916832.1 methyltransferase domain-containing protein [Cyanobium sp. ATX 6F1]
MVDLLTKPGGSPPQPTEPFPLEVRRRFARSAGRYEQLAHLQRAVAWRLGHLSRDLPLPQGPAADLGAGSGLLARALEAQRPELTMLRLDHCAELLRQGERSACPGADGSPPAPSLLWDLNGGLPDELEGAALLASSFALHWLEQPLAQLEQWCRALQPGGWLVLAVPTQGSFRQWQQAAQAAHVPCSALPLPEAQALQATCSTWLELRVERRLPFSRTAPSALALLRELKGLGASASRVRPLSAGELRALEAHWPAQGAVKVLSWELQILVGQKPRRRP